MNYFSRSRDNDSPRPDPRNDQYSRLPPQRSQGLPQGPSQSRGYTQPGGHQEKQSHYQPQSTQDYAEPSRFVVVKCPADDLALLNRLIVHPQGPFRDGDHVLVKEQFPATVKHDNTRSLQINQVGATATQRLWMQLTMGAADVQIRPLPPQFTRMYLQSLDLQIDFKKKRVETSAPYVADEVAKIFLGVFNGTVLAIGEPLVYEIAGQIIEFVVKGLSVVEFEGNQDAKMGVLMDKTDITVVKAEGSSLKLKGSAKKPPPNAILQANFRFEDMGIGGLDSEFSSIFRRAFASRVFPPGLVEKLGIQHVKGILLYGPPGTGKTLMARQIGKMLNAREPKIVNGPEILNKYVGASEENIRKLFADAEAEYKAKGDESGLHIIIFDELDAICKQRGSSNSSSGVGDSVVNQLLSKMDGVDQLNNILVIGMTNRKDMIDEALLRAGRLEVHMEINLPDERGRLQILNIHTAKMRDNHMMERDVDLKELAAATKNFSGAEIAGLIKSATSWAFTRHTKVGTTAGISDDAENLRVCKNDFENALDEVPPAFGVSQEELAQLVRNGILDYDPVVEALLHDGKLLIDQVQNSTKTPLVSVLLHGPPGTGKSALAATIAQASEFPFIKLISPESMVGHSPSQKIADINKVFSDSYKSPLSVIVIDNLERLLEWVNIGPNFSNAVLQALLVLLHRVPPKGRRLLIIATTSIRSMLLDTELPQSFDKDLHVPPVSTLPAFENVLRQLHLFRNDEELRYAMQLVAETGFGAGRASGGGFTVGMKKLLSIIEMARQEPENVAARLKSALLELRIQ